MIENKKIKLSIELFQLGILTTFVFLTLLILMISQRSYAQATNDIGLQKSNFGSPYFIDGIHCEGLTYDNNSYIYDESGAREKVKRTREEGLCHGFFTSYGLELFRWYTTEQIESVNETLRKSTDFEFIDFSIKKSDLPNHVHLFLKVKLNRKNHVSFYSDSGVFHGNTQEGHSQINHSKMDITLPSTNFFDWRLNSDTTDVGSSSPMVENQYWSSQEKAINQISSYSIFKMSIGIDQRYPQKNGDISVNFETIYHNFNSNNYKATDSNSQIYWTFFRSKREFESEAYSIYLDQESFSDFNDPTRSALKKNRLGFAGHFNAGASKFNYAKGKINFLIPSSSEDSGFYSIAFGMGWKMKNWFEQFYFDFQKLGSLNPNQEFDMGLRRRYMADGLDTSAELGFNKFINFKDSFIKIGSFVGAKGYKFQSDSSASLSQDRNAALVGLRATFDAGGFDMTGAVTYANERIH